MIAVIATVAALILLATAANASTDCTTRNSGSVTITTCSSGKHQGFSQCRSYWSGKVRKTSCR
jgi:hypothetical protein